MEWRTGLVSIRAEADFSHHGPVQCNSLVSKLFPGIGMRFFGKPLRDILDVEASKAHVFRELAPGNGSRHRCVGLRAQRVRGNGGRSLRIAQVVDENPASARNLQEL